MTKVEAGKAMMLITGTWPKFATPPMVFYAHFRHESYAEVMAAIHLLARTLEHDYPTGPSIPRIFRALEELRASSAGPKLTPDEYFFMLRQMAGTLGYHSGRRRLEQRKHQTLGRLGLIFWYRICYEPAARESLLLRDFRAAWEAMREREVGHVRGRVLEQLNKRIAGLPGRERKDVALPDHTE